MKEKKPLWRRLSAVDYLLILLLLLSLLLVGLIVMRGRSTSLLKTEVEYTVLLDGVAVRGEGERQIWEIIRAGDEVYNENGTVLLGRVTDCVATAHRTPTVVDGEIVTVGSAHQADVLITVSSEGILRQGEGIRVGEIRIAAGMTGDFRMGSYYAKGAGILWVKEGVE